MAKVIVRKADYNYNQLKPIFFDMVDTLAYDKIKPGSRVLIKPRWSEGSGLPLTFDHLFNFQYPLRGIVRPATFSALRF